MSNNLILGIDLGTTNSIASYWDGSNYFIIKNKESNLFPSIIEFSKQGKIISKNNQSNVIRNIKRIVGKSITDPDTIKLADDLNFDTQIKNDNLIFFNQYENKDYSVEELNSLILIKIKENAEKQLNIKVCDVVITIPAHFDQIQRSSILTSAKLAHLNCKRLINEPTAAAISYGLNYHNDVNILVFDLGGGTFDLSVLNIDDGIFEVINTYGDNTLGGEDFTKLIYNDALNKFIEKNKYYNLNEDLLKDNSNKLRNLCENLKCNIEENNSFFINNFYDDKLIKIDLSYNISKKELSILFKNLYEKINQYLDKIISLSDLNKEDLDYIILVGGSTKLLDIKFIVDSYFRKQSISSIDPDIVVSIGASIFGYTLNNPENPFSENIALVDILPLSIGIESNDGKMTKIVNKGEKIPVKKYKYFTTEDDNQQNVDIKIYQGERIFIKDNILIGEFSLDNIKIDKKMNVIIKVEIDIDHNGIIKINVFEKGSDNNNSFTVNKEHLLNDNNKISELINEAEYFHNLDNCKHKIRQKYAILQNQIQNLNYNCNENIYINLTNSEKEDINNHIKKLDLKLDENINTIKFLFDNNFEYENIDINKLENILGNLRKLIKINEKRFSNIILNSINTKGYTKDDNISNVKGQENNDYSNSIKKKISNLSNKIENDKNISKYTKQIIFNYLNNLLYKLNSINLDLDLYSSQLNNINDSIQHILSNDNLIINKYGNIDTIKKINSKLNLNLQINEKSSKLDIFNLIFQISNSNKINLDEF